MPTYTYFPKQVFIELPKDLEIITTIFFKDTIAISILNHFTNPPLKTH